MKASSILKKFRTEGVLIVDKKNVEGAFVPVYRVQKVKKEKGAETVAA